MSTGGLVGAGAEHFRAELLLPCAVTIGFPLEVEVADLAGVRKFSQLNQRSCEYYLVSLTIMRRAEGTAHGMIDEHGARWRDFAHDIESGANHQRGDSMTFDDVGDETDGLVAKGSVRH